MCGVRTTYGGESSRRGLAVLATGVYLNGAVIAGEFRQSSGPNGFAPATELTQNLIDLGFSVRRFKTGTPARVDGRTIDYYQVRGAGGGPDGVPLLLPLGRGAADSRRPAT